ncbi:hypothetical protein GQ54DRAFT_294815 [Martensiomyces pterosporus]|nr:hypothetical protein GQ54DRAFT_294815 [Martensiomyces pterosporus]
MTTEKYTYHRGSPVAPQTAARTHHAGQPQPQPYGTTTTTTNTRTAATAAPPVVHHSAALHNTHYPTNTGPSQQQRSSTLFYGHTRNEESSEDEIESVKRHMGTKPSKLDMHSRPPPAAASGEMPRSPTFRDASAVAAVTVATAAREQPTTAYATAPNTQQGLLLRGKDRLASHAPAGTAPSWHHMQHRQQHQDTSSSTTVPGPAPASASAPRRYHPDFLQPTETLPPVPQLPAFVQQKRRYAEDSQAHSKAAQHDYVAAAAPSHQPPKPRQQHAGFMVEPKAEHQQASMSVVYGAQAYSTAEGATIQDYAPPATAHHPHTLTLTHHNYSQQQQHHYLHNYPPHQQYQQQPQQQQVQQHQAYVSQALPPLQGSLADDEPAVYSDEEGSLEIHSTVVAGPVATTREYTDNPRPVEHPFFVAQKQQQQQQWIASSTMAGPVTSGYPAVMSNATERLGRFEPSPLIINSSQGSGAVTEASNYSRLERPVNPDPYANDAGGRTDSSVSADRHSRLPPIQSSYVSQGKDTRSPVMLDKQSPVMLDKQSPLNLAGSPMEQKRTEPHGLFSPAVPAPEHQHFGFSHQLALSAELAQEQKDTPSTRGNTRSDMDMKEVEVAQKQQQQQQQQQVLAQEISLPPRNPGLKVDGSQGAMGSPLQDRVKHSETTTAASRGITIQSLLNSPLAEPEAANTAAAVALHQHIAKENERHRRNSNAPAFPTHQHQPLQDVSSAAIDSSHNSRSSYHSAGYSIWHGRAETVNMDFATAHQSFSSNEGAGLGLSVGMNVESVSGIPTTTTFVVPPIPAHLKGFVGQLSGAGQSGAQGPWPPQHIHAFGFDYYSGSTNKPASVRAQKGNDSSDESVNGDIGDGMPTSSLPQTSDASTGYTGSAPLVEKTVHAGAEAHDQAANDRSAPAGPTAGIEDSASDPLAFVRPGRKETSESLENVLEYYRTDPEILDSKVKWDQDRSSAAASAMADKPRATYMHNASDTAPSAIPPLPALDLALMAHHQPTLSSIRYRMEEMQLSPSHQRTSFSSPVGRSEDPRLVSTFPRPAVPATDAMNGDASVSDAPLPAAAVEAAGTNWVEQRVARADMSKAPANGGHSASYTAFSGITRNMAADISSPGEPLGTSHTPASTLEAPTQSTIPAALGRAASSSSPDTPVGSSTLGTRPHEDTPFVNSPQHGAPSDEHAFGRAINERILSTRHWRVDVDGEEDELLGMVSEEQGHQLASHDWQLLPRPSVHTSIYDALNSLPEPDELVLPPTAAAMVPPATKTDGHQPQIQQQGMDGSDAEAYGDGDSGYLQMETIDMFSDFSDILNMSANQGSDYGYSSSQSSTDSFGEPIAHEAGLLSDHMLPRSPGEQTLNAFGARGGAAADRRQANQNGSQLAGKHATTSITATTIHQLLSPGYDRTAKTTSQAVKPIAPAGLKPQVEPAAAAVPSVQPAVSQQPSQAAGNDGLREQTGAVHSAFGLGRDQLSSSKGPSSGRTNATTLTTSTNPSDQGTSSDGHQSRARPSGTLLPPTLISVAAAVPTAAASNLPLEIMELASELEVTLARDQEDYYSDNISQPNLDLEVLQSLGRAVRQQCLLQRQQLQRRKSNMQLGLTGGNGSHDERNGGGKAAAEVQSADTSNARQAEFADDDQDLNAMLSEVSQYFLQSGLYLVFPFSAKWVDWLARHPDRPYPWRKDLDFEDDDVDVDDREDARAASGNVAAGDSGDEGGDYNRPLSSASSFGGDSPMLSRPIPAGEVLSKARIPMSQRHAKPAKDAESQGRPKGINAHWQYYMVINQIVTVASGIHRQLQIPAEEADHAFIAHQLAALYQFLGGDFKKYKPHIESVFDAIKEDLGLKTPPATPNGKEISEEPMMSAESAGSVQGSDGPRKVLSSECVKVLGEMMSSMVTEALYSMSKVSINKDPSLATGTHAKQDQQLHQQQQQQQQTTQTAAAALASTSHYPAREAQYALSTLKGLHTQPIIRYLNREMRVANSERRRRGLAHNLSRNSSISHLRQQHHHQYQNQPPLPPLPHQVMQLNNQNPATTSENDSGSEETHKKPKQQTPAVAQGLAKAEITAMAAAALPALQPIFSAEEPQQPSVASTADQP